MAEPVRGANPSIEFTRKGGAPSDRHGLNASVLRLRRFLVTNLKRKLALVAVPAALLLAVFGGFSSGFYW